MIRIPHKILVLATLAGSAVSLQVLAAENLQASSSQSLKAGAANYDLIDVYKLAIQNDAQLAAAKAGAKATEEQAPQARAQLLPNLSLTANTQYNKQTTGLEQQANNKKNFNSYDWGATLTQPLFNLNSWFSYGQAKAFSSQAKYQFAYQQQNLILRVSEAYFNVLRAEDSLVTAKAEEKAVKQQLDQATERYNVGLVAETDVLEARAVYDNARVIRILAENKVSVSHEQLRVITNQAIEHIGKLKKSMPVVAPIPAVANDWVQKAVVNNLSLKAAKEGVQAAEENIKAKKSGHAPTVDAFASYTYNSTDLTKGSQVPNTDNFYTGKGDQTVFGLNLTVPIFSGGATSSQVREATYKMEQSQENFDKLLRETNSNTRSYFLTANSDVDRVKAQKQGIISAESALKATISGYQVGTRNITDVLDAQQKLYASQRDYLNARYDFIINTLKLKQSAGTLSPSDIQDLNKWITFKKGESISSGIK